MLVIIIIAIIVIIGIFLGTSYNSLIHLRNNAKEAFSTMDVYLKKRFDLIPNLVETVKGYAKHESQTLESVIEARNMVANATDTNGQMEAENVLTGTLKSLFAVSENYPDLKANQNFIDLQNQLTQLESEISESRKYYNATVKAFNNAVETFPKNLIANMFGFKPMNMFEVASDAERQTVKVSF